MLRIRCQKSVILETSAQSQGLRNKQYSIKDAEHITSNY